jgi:acyl-CoA synthetase (AMP-forming)/AMP-acid ligase II
MVTRLIGNPIVAAADHANLKTIIYGGEPMYVADLKRALALLDPKLSQIYGQGEAPWRSPASRWRSTPRPTIRAGSIAWAPPASRAPMSRSASSTMREATFRSARAARRWRAATW